MEKVKGLRKVTYVDSMGVVATGETFVREMQGLTLQASVSFAPVVVTHPSDGRTPMGSDLTVRFNAKLVDINISFRQVRESVWRRTDMWQIFSTWRLSTLEPLSTSKSCW